MTLLTKLACWLFVASVATWHCIVPRDVALRDSVDVIEVHHFYDEHGRLVFDQLIGWGADDHVVFWRLIKTPDHLPKRDWSSGDYRATFMDGEQLRSVSAPAFRERWTQWDVELEDREYLAKEKRRELRRAK
jgi:hypothetical protein